jgi:hypothetical protein
MTFRTPIPPMSPIARPRASRDMGAMGLRCLGHTTAALDAESAEVLGNIKALLK